MDFLQAFMDGEIGMEIAGSDYNDIMSMTIAISSRFHGYFIDERYKNLIDYYKLLTNPDTPLRWEIIAYEPDMRTFNAYRLSLASEFRQKHNVMTAQQILAGSKCTSVHFWSEYTEIEPNDINEDDLKKVFENV